MASGRDKFKKLKGVISLLVAIDSMLGRRINGFLLKFFRNTNGVIGLLIRYVLLKNLAKSCGDNVSIHPGVYLFNLNKLSIGSNVSIHPMCYLDAAGGLSIGDNVSIAHNCSLLTANHTWDDTSLPIKYNPEVLAEVVIGNDVWLGCGVRILAGVRLANRSVIAAGAVVNRDTEKSSVYGGVPARLLKKMDG